MCLVVGTLTCQPLSASNSYSFKCARNTVCLFELPCLCSYEDMYNNFVTPEMAKCVEDMTMSQGIQVFSPMSKVIFVNKTNITHELI